MIQVYYVLIIVNKVIYNHKQLQFLLLTSMSFIHFMQCALSTLTNNNSKSNNPQAE